MDNRSEVREFLTSRRARITPELAGLPSFGGGRRVKGLRRGEVAQLAGVSVEYYPKLERGDLARAASASANVRSRRRTAPQRVRPGIQRVLDAMADAPAWIRNGRADVVANNRLGRAFYAPLFEDPVQPANTARFAFLDPRGREFYLDWEGTANDLVAVLRAEAGRDPYDRGLTDLVGELSTRSEEFRRRWAAHDVRFHRTGVKRLHHRVVGDLDLTYEALEFPSDPGLTLLVYTAEPGSATQDALNLLATWAATLDQEHAETTRTHEGA